MIPVKYCIKYESIAGQKEGEVLLNKYVDFDYDAMHSHAFIEIAYVSRGNGWHVMGNQIFRCRAGDLFIINVGDSHFWMSENDAPLTINNLIFRPGFFDATLLGKMDFSDVMGSFLLESFDEGTYYNSMYVHFSDDEQPKICSLMDAMLREFDEYTLGYRELIRSWTIELLVNVFRKYKSDPEQKSVERRAGAAALSPVIEYIDAHFTENIPLVDLASKAFLSPTYFSRVFKEYMGSTVTEYIQQKRIYLAMQLLQDTSCPVSVIAGECGYTDVKHFTRLFRRTVGVSPSDCRRRLISAKN